MAATWKPGISLRGPAGTPGIGIIQQSGPPADGLQGVDSQVYIDVQSPALTYYVYSATNSAWEEKGTLRGQMGLQGVNAELFFGEGDPDTTTYSGDGDALFIRDGDGQVFKYEKDTGWVDAGFSLRGERGADGADGKDGARGSQRFIGSGPPPADPSILSNGNVQGAVAGDEFVDITSEGAPIVYYYS